MCKQTVRERINEKGRQNETKKTEFLSTNWKEVTEQMWWSKSTKRIKNKIVNKLFLKII